MKCWYKDDSWCEIFLKPFSWIYCLLILLRRGAYHLGLFNTHRFDVPVVVVGNLTVGGNGKTPLVAAIAEYLSKQGLRPGLVARGYGGQSKYWPQAVTEESSACMVGDEPVLLVQKTKLPMVVGPDRVAAIKHLLSQYPVDVVISDDGLQHYKMHRDIEVLAIDSKRRFGNGSLLPAGPLREPVGRAKKVDYILVKTMSEKESVNLGEYKFQIEVGQPYSLLLGQLNKDSSLLNMSKKIHGVAAIAHPEQFFDTLTQLGFEVIPHAFPDHHHFTEQDIQFDDTLPVVMTEKGAVKCQQIVTNRHWALPILAKIDPTFLQKLKQDVEQHLKRLKTEKTG